MWVTRQMNQKDDRETYVRTTLRELVVYIIFLTILCISKFSFIFFSRLPDRQQLCQANFQRLNILYYRMTRKCLFMSLISIFFFLKSTVTFGMTSSTMFYYTKVLNDLFLDTPFPDDDKSFRDATQVIHFWAVS